MSLADVAWNFESFDCICMRFEGRLCHYIKLPQNTAVIHFDFQLDIANADGIWLILSFFCKVESIKSNTHDRKCWTIIVNKIMCDAIKSFYDVHFHSDTASTDAATDSMLLFVYLLVCSSKTRKNSMDFLHLKLNKYK